MDDRSRRWISALFVTGLVIPVMTLSGDHVAGDGESAGQLPTWLDDFRWVYEIDTDVDYELFDFVTIEHIEDEWTRVVNRVYTEDDETFFEVYEQHRGNLSAKVTYGIFTLDLDLRVIGNGWTYIRARDLAVVRSVSNTTYTSQHIPFVGRFTGGFDNATTYEPPMPLAVFPISPPTPWAVKSTVNTTTKFYVVEPQDIANETWYNLTEVYDLTVTPSGPTIVTVPAGPFLSYRLHETGTLAQNEEPQNVDRNWHYADTAASVVVTTDGYELKSTTARFIPPNLPPVGPDGTVELGTDEDVPLPIDLSEHFSDPDEDVLTYSLKLVGGSTANASLERDGSVFTLSPAGNWSGILDLHAEARDPGQGLAVGELRVTVDPVNDPPHVIMEPQGLIIDEDKAVYNYVDLLDVFGDVDGDDLNFVVEADVGVSGVLNGTHIDLIPDLDWVGEANVLLTALDPSGEEAYATFRVLVGAVNDPPVIVGSGGPARIHESENGTFWIIVQDLDSDELEIMWFVDGGRVTGATGTEFTFEPGDALYWQVVISVMVEDEWNAWAELEWTVDILDSPRITTAAPPTPVEALIGDTVSFWVTVEDADTPDLTVTWRWNGDVVGTGSTLELVLGAEDAGEGVLECLASDGIGADTRTWNVTVLVPNLEPTVIILSPQANGSLTLGRSITLKCAVDDEDPPSLSVRWFVDGSPVGSGTEVDYVPTRVGRIVIQVTVSDDKHSVTSDVPVTVASVDDGANGEEERGELFGSYAVIWLLVIVLLIVLAAVFRTRHGRPD